jgi:large subunit ribosomal protein L24
MKIKKNDEVVVITGKDAGKTGRVLEAFPKENRLVVAGVNEAKKHQRPTQGSAGGIVVKNLSIHVSNVAILDPKDKKPTKVGYKTLKDGKKVRFAKKSGEVLDV